MVRKRQLGLNLSGGSELAAGAEPEISQEELQKHQLGTAIYLLELFRIQILEIDGKEAVENSIALATNFKVLEEYGLARQQIKYIEMEVGNG